MYRSDPTYISEREQRKNELRSQQQQYEKHHSDSESDHAAEEQQDKDLELLNEGMQDIPYELLLQANKKQGQGKGRSKELGIKTRGIFVEQKKLGKKGPVQRTCRVPVSRKKTIFKSSKIRTVDPRFDPNATTEYNPVQFSQTYEFLNDMRKVENRQINTELRSLKKRGQSETDYADKLKKTLSKNKGDLNVSYNNKRMFAAKSKLRAEIRETGTRYKPSKIQNFEQLLTPYQRNTKKS